MQKRRTLGWIQDASDIKKLRNIVEIFVANSETHKRLCENIIPNLDPNVNKRAMLKQLSTHPMSIDFSLLVGKGTRKGETRATAPCSGIAQAVLPAQNGRSYQSDWATKSFVIWAIAIGFLAYDSDTDKCSLTESGFEYATSAREKEKMLLINAHLSYPPVCRILNLLGNSPDEFLTKYEIGGKFGFTGENGFTSYGVRFIVDGVRQRQGKERNKFINNTEGTSDKYVRTICSWLVKLGLVETGKKTIEEMFDEHKYSCEFRAYRLTVEGRKALNRVNGKSIYERLPKIVYYEMLATKASDAEYLRLRRALLIKYLVKGYKSLASCVDYLEKNKMKDDKFVVKDDIDGLENIGLSVIRKRNGDCRIADNILCLSVPQKISNNNIKSRIEQIKDKVRPVLKTIDHKYLALIDFGFGQGHGADRDFEFMTADLLTCELDFKGARLGEARRPDVCVYYNSEGVIIDNKAYKKGYSLPINHADEMTRYIEENKLRSAANNATSWWKVFDKSVQNFCFAFISGAFIGSFKERLENIHLRTGLNGAAITSADLLILAEAIKTGSLSYEEAIAMIKCNNQIVVL